MSTPPDRPLDAPGLARNGTLVERSFPIAGFARLRDRLAEPMGRAAVRAEFRQEGRWPVALLRVDADVVLTCQRCLRPVRLKLESASQLVFAAEETPELPEDHEIIGGDPRKLDLAALVEDELLLSLPLIPQHDAGEACALPDGTAMPAVEMQSPETRRPFAGLKDLLKN